MFGHKVNFATNLSSHSASKPKKLVISLAAFIIDHPVARQKARNYLTMLHKLMLSLQAEAKYILLITFHLSLHHQAKYAIGNLTYTPLCIHMSFWNNLGFCLEIISYGMIFTQQVYVNLISKRMILQKVFLSGEIEKSLHIR